MVNIQGEHIQRKARSCLFRVKGATMRTLNFSTSKICRYLVPYDTTEFDDAIFEVSCTVSSNDTMYIAKL